jgi:chromosomal replication initiation ATPase DnaA
MTRQTIPRSSEPHPLLAPTLARVCTVFLVFPEEVLGKDKSPRICRARDLCAWVCRQLYPVSYPELGRMLNRNHTSVMDGVLRAQKRIDGDPEFAVVANQFLEATPMGAAEHALALRDVT